VKLLLSGSLFLFLLLTARITRSPSRLGTRTWEQGDAEILEVRAVTSPTRVVDESAPASYTVRARIRTVDGRHSTAWADGRYAVHATAWSGRTIPAWYDPAHPECFRLRPPDPTTRLLAASIVPLVLVGLLILFAAHALA
jgi:Protein of unknown function (DUF3592)